MILSHFEEACTQEWVDTQITNLAHELVVLRQVIPWQTIIMRLGQFYDHTNGRLGKSLRTMVALLILARLRQLSDQEVVQQVKENRYYQYFCNVSDGALATFVHPSVLCRIRQRFGPPGIAIIETEVFERLRRAGVIQGETLLMDSTVLESSIVYPHDVRLLYKAFGKMAQVAQRHAIPLWWNQAHLKKRWRAFGLAKKGERLAYLAEFFLLFMSALESFRAHVTALKAAKHAKEQAHGLLDVLTVLENQTRQKLAGVRHIEHRLVSLDEVEARPIKKGKTHPACEFGTTLQLTFNRQGFLITTENFIGQPNDKTLYGGTLQQFKARMGGYPTTVVTDLGFRSPENFKQTPEAVTQVFLGRSDDVSEMHQERCCTARSATEGFIAVAKHLRGFGCSLYRGLRGDQIWTLLNQTAYNLKKFLQRYWQEELEEKSLQRLGLLTAV